MVGIGEKSERNHLAAIYVHAGAGYHSASNEQIHLSACAKAASVGMLVLRNHGSAVDAVEVAIRSLEDNDVTNAGYGSNLNTDGAVECDATIVDHLGRSGAVGAMPNIRNPITVARAVYEESIKPMTLKRVAPNLLTGYGATEFAQEHGIRYRPNDELVSSGAKERFRRWKREIDMAQEAETETEEDAPSDAKIYSPEHREYRDVQEAMDKGAALSTNPTIAALANESQPFSPESGSSRAATAALNTPNATPRNYDVDEISDRYADNRTQTAGEFDSYNDLRQGFLSEEQHLSIEGANAIEDREDEHLGLHNYERPTKKRTCERVSVSSPTSSPTPKSRRGNRLSSHNLPAAAARQHGQHPSQNIHRSHEDSRMIDRDDLVSDTVGAIAIDDLGRVAAASSSGGIGMKHRGRTGPAALVGIGTAVLPIDPEDENENTAACVTSGTGEHMATSMAAHVCAQRVLFSKKIGKEGDFIDTDENDAMKSFVQKEFMNHPAIKASHSSGAIGAMVVKKSRDGMWLYWVHNTDSFALASMHAEDDEPYTAMSRNRKAGRIATGARSMRPLKSTTIGSTTKTHVGRRRKGARTVTDKAPKNEAASGGTTSARLFSSPSKFRKSTPKQDADGAESVGSRGPVGNFNEVVE